ncbi:hypothetical protein AeNC1_007692 [Aphanomyces euteiches]|nr:hypothetical protein AeNC1_007692 [Aphanomyces euteiches]
MLLAAACGTAVTVYEVDRGILREGRKITSSSETEATCAVWNHNNRILVSSFENGLISINTIASQENASVCNLAEGSVGENSCVNDLHLSSGSRYLISGGVDCVVRIWDLKRQNLKYAFAPCNSNVHSVSFAGQSDEYIAAGCESGDLYLYHAQHGSAAGVCQELEDTSAIHSVVSSPHPFLRDKLGCVYASGALRLWDLATMSLQTSLSRLHWAPATRVVFSPIHKHLVATSGLDKRVVFTDVGLSKEINCLESPHPITAMSMHPHGQVLATGTSTGHVLLYDLRNATSALSIFQVGLSPVKSIQLSQEVPASRRYDSESSKSSFVMPPLQTSLINLVPPPLPPPAPTTTTSTPPSPVATGIASPLVEWDDLRRELQDVKTSLSDEIQMVHLEILRQHQAQQMEFMQAMSDLKQEMHQLVLENQQLRQENERLKHSF